MPLSRVRSLLLFVVSTFAYGCGGGGPTNVVTPPPACTFVNPLATGADPWVVRQGANYYSVQSNGRSIAVSKSSKLTTAVTGNAVQVWTAPDTGWNHGNVWAPELHYIDGKWYIYYAAGRNDGGPFIYQRAGVLQATTDDPQGPYVDRGMLYTGSHLAADTSSIWAIDLTVGRINGQLYAVWSGWMQNATTDATPQHLFIAPMSNPYTISADRELLASPDQSWERGTQLDLEEGPEFLMHAGQVFIVYSTRESFLPDYRLGELRLATGTADPMIRYNWTKTGPVFTGAGDVYGVGHASFTTSPDSTEDWIVYHAKSLSSPGWNDRVIRTQKFTWNTDASPNFGTPVPTGAKTVAPSGECAKS